MIIFEKITSHPIRDELLFCLSSRPHAEKAMALKDLSQQEWIALTAEAMRFDVMPLLGFRLGGKKARLIPEGLGKEFERKWFLYTSGNLLVQYQLGVVLKKLAQANIQVCVLKGAYLTQAVYKDAALRSMGDVDFLVRREHLTKTVEVLEDLGYRTAQPFWIEDECAIRHHLPAFTQPGQPIIEVHWTLVAPTQPVRVDLEGLWQRMEPLKTAGVQAFALSPVDLIAHLCLHTCRDRFVFGLRALCDVQECVGYFEASLDWDELRLRAQQWGIERCVFLTLYLASRALKAEVPQDFLDRLCPADFTSQVSDWALEQVFEGRITATPTAITQMQGRKPIRDKFASILKGFFPPPVVIRKKYFLAPTSWFVVFYYFFHFVDLLRLHGKSMFQLLWGQPGVVLPAQRVNALAEWLFP